MPPTDPERLTARETLALDMALSLAETSKSPTATVLTPLLRKLLNSDLKRRQYDATLPPTDPTAALRTALTECVFVPAHEPWTCSVHDGIRTSLDEPQCDVVRPAEPSIASERARIRAAVEGLPVDAGGILEVSRETVLAIIDALAASQADDPSEQIEFDRSKGLGGVPQADDPSGPDVEAAS